MTYAIEEDVAFVLIAGDLFDGEWKDYATGQFFVRETSRLTRANIRVVLIKGNHDAASVVSKSLPMPEGVRILSHRTPETVELPEHGVAVHGQSFPHRAVPENLALKYPVARPERFNIGLLHTSLAGYSEHQTYAPCTPDDLHGRGYDYWALGHVHQREVMERGTTIVFPGNLQGRNIRETGPKGATLVTLDTGRIAAIDFVPLDAARWAEVDVDLSGTERWHEMLSRVKAAIERAADTAEGRPLAIRLRVAGETSLSAELFAARVRLAEEIQAIAAHVTDSILVERVKLLTTSARGATAVSGAIVADELDTAFDAVIADQAFDDGLSSELSEIVDKLPAESARASGLPTSPERRAEILGAARALVVGRLRGITNGGSRAEELEK